MINLPVAAGAAVHVEMIMDSLNPDVPDALALDRLCAGAAEQLLLRCYSQRTLNRYKLVWKQLTDFAQAHAGGNTYSRELALRFEQAFGIRDSKQLKKGERWRRHLVFGIKILDDFVRTGTITRFVVETTGLRIPAGMHKPLCDYEQYARERRHLRPLSLAERMHCIAVFLDFLDFLGGCGLESLEQIQVSDISAFIVSRSIRNPNTGSRAASNLRQFFQFLFLRDILPKDFSIGLPKFRTAKLAGIPSVWEPELVVKLLGVVDRSSPKGKRDYAILLLAARLGMRQGDIKGLTLDDLRWTSATIEIAQAKTGALLVLPMSEEVGSALIDYLRAGRPAVAHRQVFLNLTPPFDPFAERDHLYKVVNHWRELAGIEFRSKQRQGLHSLRHTLATRLLHAETPFHVISGILGHASPATTFIYAKADVETLRIAALNPEELNHGQ